MPAHSAAASPSMRKDSRGAYIELTQGQEAVWSAGEIAGNETGELSRLSAEVSAVQQRAWCLLWCTAGLVGALCLCLGLLFATWSSMHQASEDMIALRVSVGTLEKTMAMQSHATTLLMDDSVVFVGRVHRAADGTVSFDMNGVQVQATVTGTTGLYASMSQVQKIEGNTFQVFLDGVLQPGSRFNTSSWVAGQVVKVPLFASGSLAAGTAHAVTIFKDTEPQFSGTRVAPNFVTFHGFSGDSGARLLAPVPRSSPQHRVEFLGDSITAGFDNQCDIPGSPKGFPWSESFAKSWARPAAAATPYRCLACHHWPVPAVHSFNTPQAIRGSPLSLR